MKRKSKAEKFFSKLIAFTMAAAFVLTSAMIPVSAAPDLLDYSADNGNYRNVMYYGDWSIWGGQNNFYPKGIAADQITHLNFAFLDFDANGNLMFTDNDAAYGAPVGMSGVSWGDANAGILNALQDLREQNPNLRVGVSVGGWSKSKDFTPVAADPVIRARFISNLCKFLKYTNMDFIDYDWEYPGAVRAADLIDNKNDEGTPLSTPADKENFITLLQETKDALQAQGAELGKVYELSVALPATKAQLDRGVNIAEVFRIVDFANIMTYDLTGAWSDHTGHHTALYSRPNDPNGTGLSVHDSVTYLLSQGAVANKIVIGCAFYTRGWEKVDIGSGTVPGMPGLFASVTPVNKNAANQLCFGAMNLAPIAMGDGGHPGGLWSYGTHDKLNTRYPDMVRYWDDVAKAPYLYNEATGAFFSYDDPESIRAKIQYVKENHLGGAISWMQSQDKTTATGKRDELTRVIKQELFGSASLPKYKISKPSIEVEVTVSTYTDTTNGGYNITIKNIAAANESNSVLGLAERAAETVKMPKLYIKSASGANFSTGGYGSGTVTNANGYGIVDMSTVYANKMIPQGKSVTFQLKSNKPANVEDIVTIELAQRIQSPGAEIGRQLVYGGGDPLPVNTPPVISGVTDQTILVGDTFDTMQGVAARDAEDGDLTDQIICTGSVNTAVAGSYTLTYSVTDSGGKNTQKSCVITVKNPTQNTPPVISGATDWTIAVGDSFDPMAGVTASDAEDGTITSQITYTGSVNTAVAGTYLLTYSVTDQGGATTTVSRRITVEEKTVPIDPSAYDPDKIYVAGDEVTYNGETYRAKWWVKGGGTPDVNSAWEKITNNTNQIPEYNANQAYVKGDRVTYNGSVYEAKWWVRGYAPGTNDAWMLIE